MTQTPEATVLHLERQFNQAVLNRDIATAQSLLAESYFLAIGIEGRPLTIVSRADWLETLSGYMLDFHSLDAIQVHIYGDVAVVLITYRQQGQMPGGRDISGSFLLTDIWVNGPAGWLIVERHSSRQEKLPVRQ